MLPYPVFAAAAAASSLHRVMAGKRPSFPAGTPAAYEQLTCACWAQDPEQRPSAEAIINTVQQMLDQGSSLTL
jgi:Protein tyrosine and serine/threonine kinase